MKHTAKNMNNRCVKSDPYRFLKEFDNSGYNCVQLEGYPHKNAQVCATSLRAIMKRHKIHHIEVVRRGDVIYVFRKNCRMMNYIC